MTYDKFKLLTKEDIDHIIRHYVALWGDQPSVAVIPFLHDDRLRLLLNRCDHKHHISDKLGLELITKYEEWLALLEQFQCECIS